MDTLRNSGPEQAADEAGAPTAASTLSVPEDLRRESANRSQHFNLVLKQPAPLRIQFGQIWSSRPAADASKAESAEDQPMPRLVVTLDEGSEQALLGQPALGVAPTSLDLAYASDCDLLVPEEESPLGYPFMIEVWNEVQVLQEQLGRYLGTLPQPFKRYLGLLHEAQFGIEVDLSPLIPHIGPPITHRDDPRFAFQEDEHEACEYLGLPVMSALGESEDSEASEPARTVRSLLHKHVPSGFPELDSTTTPLTVGDVAARLQSDHAAGRPIPSVDRLTNQRLLRNGIAVSRPVTAAVVAQLKELLHVEGSDRYWEVFRQAAVKLGMARQQGQIQLVAARRQQQGYRRTPARRSRKHPERQEE